MSMALAAQQAPTFKSGTQIVSLFVTVQDAQKRLVPELVQTDFDVFDNDKPQPLVYFDFSPFCYLSKHGKRAEKTD